MRKGESLADVLLGDYNPSGRTPETWYQSVDNLPSIYSYALRPAGPNGRTYMYYTGPVSYPFGYGLSYTTFHFSNLHISRRHPTADDTINVSVDVTNTQLACRQRDRGDVREHAARRSLVAAADQATGGIPEGVPRPPARPRP